MSIRGAKLDGLLNTRLKVATTTWTGQFSRAMDDKSRAQLPSEWRKTGDGFRYEDMVLAPAATMDCFRLYSASIWEQKLEVVKKMPESHRVALFFRRSVIGNAHRVKVDGSGRVLIPASLREMFSIERDLVMVGQDGYVEFWEPTRWQEEIDKLRLAAPDYLDTLAEMNL